MNVQDTLIKKRGRKKKIQVDETDIQPISNSDNTNISFVVAESTDSKKRGRQPKGGKLTTKNISTVDVEPPITNVILHLKCSLKDVNEYNIQMNKIVTDPLNYNSEVPPEIMTYNTTTNFSAYHSSDNNDTVILPKESVAYVSDKPSTDTNFTTCNSILQTKDDRQTTDDLDNIQIKDVNQKLKKLKINLYKNSIPDKKSACFWCTYDFDNYACYIPRYEMDGSICGYGSFCRPECAVAFLMKENIDDSTKFERYHLLNQLYSKVYDFKNNIKPAPNPYFLLDKYYGNLTIQEYRKLLGTKHMLLVVDKPLTRILPELHEDTDDFIIGLYGGAKGGATQAGGVYKVKRQSEKQPGPSKSSIMKGNFGISQ